MRSARDASRLPFGRTGDKDCAAATAAAVHAPAAGAAASTTTGATANGGAPVFREHPATIGPEGGQRLAKACHPLRDYIQHILHRCP